MKETFISLLTEFIDKNGKKILDQPDRFKSLFLDFSQNEYRAEAQIFSQFLASPQAQELKNSDDVDTVFLKVITERFYQACLFDKVKCEISVKAYAWFLGLIDKTTFEKELGGIAVRQVETSQVKMRQEQTIPIAIYQEASPAQSTPATATPVTQKKDNRLIFLFVALLMALAIFGMYTLFFPSQRAQQPTPVATPQPVPQTTQSTPTSQPAASPARSVPNNMVYVQGGTFTMGSPANEPGRRDDEGPQHRVTISGFYMGKNQVTQKEWREVMGTTLRQQRDKIDPGWSIYGEGDNHPMYYVSWYETIEYCNRLSQQEGLSPAYTINGTNVSRNPNASGYRLPTEAEWEYACRAGTTTAYNTGASISNNTGWYESNSGDTTHPVGQKTANAWGLYDMHGNVWDWCWDWYGDYSSSAQTDPIVDTSSGSYRTFRGGSFNGAAQNIRSAYRGYNIPSHRSYGLGFRIVRLYPEE